MKAIDWDLYCRLKSPVAKRRYRFLDKRFYHGGEVVIDLHELAFRKLRLSESYNTAQIKRVLLKGIAELETLWELRSCAADRRFRKLSQGRWEAVFVKRRPRPAKAEPPARPLKPESDARAAALVTRGVTASVATELVAQYPQERIQTMIELHDWHNARRQQRGPGFIVAGIRSREPYAWPQGFKPSARTVENSRIRPVRENCRPACHSSTKPTNDELAPFLAFWDKLAAPAQANFERQALAHADPHKRRWFEEARHEGRETANYFGLAILNDHFRRVVARQS